MAMLQYLYSINLFNTALFNKKKRTRVSLRNLKAKSKNSSKYIIQTDSRNIIDLDMNTSNDK